jgi:hypothetical protein
VFANQHLPLLQWLDGMLGIRWYRSHPYLALGLQHVSSGRYLLPVAAVIRTIRGICFEFRQYVFA